jgi:hypothetical protein
MKSTLINQRKRRRLDPHTIMVIKQVLIGLMVFSLIGLVITGIWYGTRLQALTITQIEVSGGETISHDEVKSKAWGQLEGSYLRLIPKVFAWTYPEEKVFNAANEVNRIKDVLVYRDGQKVLINFGEYVPDALWCDGQKVPNCLFLDKNGYAFSPAPVLTGGTLLRFTTIGGEPKLKEHFANEENYLAIQKLILLLNDSGWYIYKVDLDAASDAFIHVVGGGELKVTLLQTPTETVNNLVTVLNSDEFKHITPGNFKYIDLRFGNKVFVNEVLVSEVVPTASSSEAVTTVTTETEIPE